MRARLTGRGTDAPEVVERRLREAAEECRHALEFDYLVVNDDFREALSQLLSIVTTQRLRMDRQEKRHAGLLSELMGSDEASE